MKHLTNDNILSLRRSLAILKAKAEEEIRLATEDLDAALQARIENIETRTDDLEFNRYEEIRRAEIEMDRRLLGRIEEAEQRIREGGYGICVDCNEPIAYERLLALPTAIKCAACERAHGSPARR